MAASALKRGDGATHSGVCQRTGRSYAIAQAAKTTLFAAGNEGDIRKNRRRRFFPIN
jgi:hypothetical protein